MMLHKYVAQEVKALLRMSLLAGLAHLKQPSRRKGILRANVGHALAQSTQLGGQLDAQGQLEKELRLAHARSAAEFGDTSSDHTAASAAI